MRRPLKPFVTEYKGSRRASSSFAEPPSFEAERPTPKPVDSRPRSEPDSEDAYEAAMRAADALFSPGPARNGAGDVGKPPSTFSSSSSEIEPAAPERAGRVLRVIDEAPSPQLVALEAERTPKRRGRKPGSKNKPKLAVVEPTPHAVEASVDYAEAVASTHNRVTSTKPTFHTPRQVTALASAPTPQNDASGKRYSWVRDRLKPGEGWKRRRLPRVCW